MLDKLQNFLYEEIPLTQQMGLTLVEFRPLQLIIKAPLKPNINDKGTVFGGSSSALMIITAWSLIKLNCQQFGIDADIVIHKNETTWQKALSSELIIKANIENSYDFGQIKKSIDSGKHQRVMCQIALHDQQQEIYSTMSAKYVIIPKTKNIT